VKKKERKIAIESCALISSHFPTFISFEKVGKEKARVLYIP
jgi:hypothetical protein